MPDFDVIVVGAGPAGSIAALELARGGASVALIERGVYPGSKNMYGGVVYPRILDSIIPNWHEEAPIQRHVTRRQTMMMTDHQAMTVDFRTTSWGSAPYNGVTAFRSEWDRWLAQHAVDAGATLICSTTVTGLLRDANRIIGVTTDRSDGDLTADLVVACDGANSFLAREAGLYKEFDASHFTLGVKEVLHLGKDEIDRRFNVSDHDGVDIEMVGATGPIAGGGFLYTNLDSVAVGVVLKLNSLAAANTRPEDVIATLKRHPAIAPLVAGGELVEYSAHLIPEGGYDAMPTLGMSGLLVCGDAASLTLAAGIWLEGVNFAMASWAAAAQAALEAREAGRPAEAHRSYRSLLEGNFVLQDHKRLRHMPELIFSHFVQHQQAAMVCDVVEDLFTVTNPTPKPRLRRIVNDARKANGVTHRDLLRTTWRAAKMFF
ncbi:MAG: FAD-dependent oxidoreductase [Actinomycetes bacterium]